MLPHCCHIFIWNTSERKGERLCMMTRETLYIHFLLYIHIYIHFLSHFHTREMPAFTENGDAFLYERWDWDSCHYDATLLSFSAHEVPLHDAPPAELSHRERAFCANIYWRQHIVYLFSKGTTRIYIWDGEEYIYCLLSYNTCYLEGERK